MERRDFIGKSLGTACASIVSRQRLFAQAVQTPQQPEGLSDGDYAYAMAGSGDLRPWMKQVIAQEIAEDERATQFGVTVQPATSASLAATKPQLIFKSKASGDATNELWLHGVPNIHAPAGTPYILRSDEALGIVSSGGAWQYAATKTGNRPEETIVIRGLRNTGAFADDDPPMYYTLNEITVKDITVPQYFVTDLTSIPKAFCCLLRPDGPYAYAAIAHDWLYWNQQGKKEDADWLLKVGMEQFNVSQKVVDIIYEAVKKFGGKAWANNTKAKAHGEKRQLKVLPTDPRTKWSDWKLDPSHTG